MRVAALIVDSFYNQFFRLSLLTKNNFIIIFKFIITTTKLTENIYERLAKFEITKCRFSFPTITKIFLFPSEHCIYVKNTKMQQRVFGEN